MGENEGKLPQSLLPYETWAGEALRQVVVEALDHVARHGLPGGHHFYLTFRTGDPGVEMPAHLRSRFADEMTIVLQHQFWDLAVERPNGRFRVGVSFGGVPANLVVPFAALTAFADPEVQFGLRFAPLEPQESTEKPRPKEASGKVPPEPPEAPQVVSLDAFRHRASPKE
ncbi:MAG: ClpXP protease specificity-enhancing factor SspB [Rhodospirillales bacterium]|nr:ClpXP protease specificity-enhancing factor SspB [Rhodospirillales bacterium]